MAALTYDSITEYSTDYTLKLVDGDRIRIEGNGEYITFIRLADGELSYLGSEQIRVI